MRTKRAEERAEVAKIREECEELRAVVAQQQRFMEQLDSRDRDCNLIITGVPEEEAFDDAVNDIGWKLFVAYVDFSKAYDRVPRNKLLCILKRLGCGFMMLFAIGAMYKVTKSILGTAVITAAIGVRQGSPTSCVLFNLFVDTLIVMFKQRCDNDGFFSWLHVLILMDDTVILATSRRKLEEKLNILWDYCDTHTVCWLTRIRQSLWLYAVMTMISYLSICIIITFSTVTNMCIWVPSLPRTAA